MKERLQKILSAAGVCSRRASENYITAGRITINGETAQLGQQADPETDDIRVDGVPLGQKPEAVYLMLNKPRGYVTTVSDEQGRKTVMDLLTGIRTRVYPVGRLGNRAELSITIHEGRNRQIRRMCAQCDLEVLRLQRVREHCLELGTLPSGRWRYLTPAEIAALKDE